MVVTGGNHQLRVGAERDRVHGRRVPAEHTQVAAAPDVPHVRDAAVHRNPEQPSVGTEREIEDGARRTVKDARSAPRGGQFERCRLRRRPRAFHRRERERPLRRNRDSGDFAGPNATSVIGLWTCSVRMTCREFASIRRAVPRASPTRSLRRSGLTASPAIGARERARTASSGSIAGSHTRAVPSSPTVRTDRPSGLNIAYRTGRRARRTGQILRRNGRRPHPTRARFVGAGRDDRRPVGLNATDVTAPAWPIMIATWAPFDVVQMRAVPSVLAAATSFPFGLNATPTTWRLRADGFLGRVDRRRPDQSRTPCRGAVVARGGHEPSIHAERGVLDEPLVCQLMLEAPPPRDVVDRRPARRSRRGLLRRGGPAGRPPPMSRPPRFVWNDPTLARRASATRRTVCSATVPVRTILSLRANETPTKKGPPASRLRMRAARSGVPAGSTCRRGRRSRGDPRPLPDERAGYHGPSVLENEQGRGRPAPTDHSRARPSRAGREQRVDHPELKTRRREGAARRPGARVHRSAIKRLAERPCLEAAVPPSRAASVTPTSKA